MKKTFKKTKKPFKLKSKQDHKQTPNEKINPKQVLPQNCKDNRNLPIEITEFLLDYETTYKAFKANKFAWVFPCPNCGSKMGFDIRTCLPIDLSTVSF